MRYILGFENKNMRFVKYCGECLTIVIDKPEKINYVEDKFFLVG